MSSASNSSDLNKLSFAKVPIVKLFRDKSWVITTVLVGAILEYYSYMLLASMISKSEFISFFFGSYNSSNNILKGTLFFFIAALSRPVGALIFGFIGDKYGRRQALFTSLVTMALSCFIIALLPGYESIGTYAIIVLFISRVAQIMSASGETNGAPIFLIEHFGLKRSCLASGLAYFGTMLGSTLASFAASFSAWRSAFLIGGLAGFVGLLIRVKVLESEEFKNSKAQAQINEKECQVVQKGSYLIVGLISAACSSGFYFLYIGLPALSIQFNQLTTYGTALYAAILLATGFIADYLSLFTLMRAGALAYASFALLLLANLYASFSILLYFGLVIALGVFAAPSHAFMYRFFPPKCRYRAVSISYSIATATIGAGTPYIVKTLTSHFHSSLAAAAWICPIMICAYFTLKKAEKLYKSC